MNITPDQVVRVRFAPSPTGHLHIGGLRTALFNWLFAHHSKGVFLIRIEDTDTERSKKIYEDAIYQALDWVGIHSDEPIMVQSKCDSYHQSMVEKLLLQHKAYKCYCSSQDIIERAGGNAFISYDGYCRNNAQEKDSPYVVRFRLPAFETISFDDLVRGEVIFDRNQLDDFIIVRSDGRPIYNFVVVADDAAMNITHVIRGEDHISNTPKQILLYQALELPIPYFAHIPLILGPSGDRLSKRDGATSVLEYKKMGYLPNALINYLARLGWSYGDQEIFDRAELIHYFTLANVGKKGAIFDFEKLNWVNSVYLKKMETTAIKNYIVENIDNSFSNFFRLWDGKQLLDAISLYKERVSILTMLIQEIKLLYNGPEEYNSHDLEHWINPHSLALLGELSTHFSALDIWNAEQVTYTTKQFAKQQGIKFALIAQPIRLALIGKSDGPGVFSILEILGKKESLKRIAHLIHACKQNE